MGLSNFARRLARAAVRPRAATLSGLGPASARPCIASGPGPASTTTSTSVLGRSFSASATRRDTPAGFSADEWQAHKNSFHFPRATPRDAYAVGTEVTVLGFLGKRRDVSARSSFVHVAHPGHLQPVQFHAAWTDPDSPEHDVYRALRAVPSYSAVCATGIVEELPGTDSTEGAGPTVRLTKIQTLNAFPRDIVVSKGAQFPPSKRHLQMRFSDALRWRLAFRSDVAAWSRQHMRDVAGLREFETPVLFKSTPEGAREFLVPTRRPGYAYALPQSPQQFKQILMAAGVAGGYFQMARCFRDEDLRADRQPEFTQLDLEMAFASGADVMDTVERYARELVAYLGQTYRLAPTADGDTVPMPLGALSGPARDTAPFPALDDTPFPRMDYVEAMTKHGVDKPDLRIPGEIHSVGHILPDSFTSMITKLDRPVVDAWRFRLGPDVDRVRAFVRDLFDNLPRAVADNADGMPAVMVYDTRQPLCGLAALGHEAFGELTDGGRPELAGLADLEDGDVLFLQARPDRPLSGGSTMLGVLRSEAYRRAVAAGLVPRDDRLLFLWVVGFPMFTRTDDATSTDPGQGGSAGFSATHHPFTAPLTEADFEMLAVDPLRARADHYDLVLNGVELGGGSRRIHVAAVQRFVMRDILGMPPAGVAQFAHLLAALDAGCPPHAGFALGFDRLAALLSGTGSVRDVIAFPKSMKGEDLTLKSPGRVTPAELAQYSLQLKK